jgi:hypothetical protein
MQRPRTTNHRAHTLPALERFCDGAAPPDRRIACPSSRLRAGGIKIGPLLRDVAIVVRAHHCYIFRDEAGLIIDYHVFKAYPKSPGQPNIVLWIAFKNGEAALDKSVEVEDVTKKVIGSIEFQNKARHFWNQYGNVLGTLDESDSIG